MGSLPKEQNAPKTVSLGFLHPFFDLLAIKSLANLLSKLKRVNCEIRPGRPNGPIGESKMPTSTCPTKVGPIL